MSKNPAQPIDLYVLLVIGSVPVPLVDGGFRKQERIFAYGPFLTRLDANRLKREMRKTYSPGLFVFKVRKILTTDDLVAAVDVTRVRWHKPPKR
jgi:hypothetical protein